MIFPFESLSGASRELGLVVAVLIGVAFGFVLERAGFGRAPKLAAQFYLRDMTVLKVMFTAIVTAMLGLVIASGFGLADLRSISESIASWTYVWPMLVGGFVLGVGFIISGYCPGTSIVAASSGNLDGLVTVGGVVTGTFLYSELLRIPAFERFHNSGEKGAWFLYDLVPVAPQILAFVVALMAVGAFVGAQKIEKVSPPTRRRLAFATVGILAAIALVTIAIPPAVVSAAPAATPTLDIPQLAHAIVEVPWSVRIADVRGEAAFAKSRIPGSELVAPDTLADIARQAHESGRKLFVVDNRSFAAWEQFALTAPQPPPAGAPQAQIDEYLFRNTLHQAMTGTQQSVAPVIARPGAVVKPKKRGGGCST